MTDWAARFRGMTPEVPKQPASNSQKGVALAIGGAALAIMAATLYRRERPIHERPTIPEMTRVTVPPARILKNPQLSMAWAKYRHE